MTRQERDNWIVNIDNSAAAIESEIGSATANAIRARYGASCTEEISPVDLPEVFSEIYAVEADLR